MNTSLNFSLNSFDFVEESKNELFQKVRIKAFSSGENSNTMPVDEDVLINGAKTIYDNPILWKYNRFTDDANGHDEDEVPCGFIKEEKDNPVKFEREPDGRLFICINALIWKKYSGKLLEIFKRTDNKKNVSIEMMVKLDNDNEYEKPKIKEFVISGITILGEYIPPACKGSMAEIIEFSQKEFNRDKDNYIKMNDGIIIDNNNFVFGTWRNPRRKLYLNIVNSKNEKDLLKESYLIVNNEENINMSDCLYPHHIYENGKLLLHVSGLISSANMAKKKGSLDDDSINHIKRHVKEIGLNDSNFKNYNISEEQYKYFSDNILFESVGEKELDNEKMNEKMEEKKDESVVLEEEKKMENEEKMEEKKEEEKMEEDNDSKTEDEDKEDEDKEDDDKDENKMSEKMKCMEQEIQNLKNQIQGMSDYEELKKFKEETIKKQEQEENMKKMQEIFYSIEEKGLSITEDDKNSLCKEFEKFSNIDAWSNYVKSTIFDNMEKFSDFVKIDTFDNKKNKSTSVWDRL